MISYDSIFHLFLPVENIFMGAIDCSNNGCDGVCSSDSSQYHTISYSSLKDTETNFSFEATSNVRDGKYVYYGDYVKILSQYSPLRKKGYYITASDCSTTNYPSKISNSNETVYQTFKVTVPPGVKNRDGNPLVDGGMLALKMETKDGDLWNNTYLYYNPSKTGTWVFQYPSTSKESQHSTWSLTTVYNPNSCGRPSPTDQNMFHADGSNYGDKNYGEVKSDCRNTIQGHPSTPDGMEVFKIDGKDSICGIGTCFGDFSGVCEVFGKDTSLLSSAACGNFDKACGCGTWTSCPTARWGFIGKWEPQTQTSKNQIMCCGGKWSSSDNCHPYYCPQNTGSFNLNDKDGGSCPNIMSASCTAENWSKQYLDPSSEDAYIGQACDSYVSLGDKESAKNVVKKTVKDFYTSNKPTDDHPFVRKSVELCSLFPGACDDTLKNVCSVYTNEDLDTKKWSGRQWDKEGTNLLDICGCFLNNDQYLCYDKDGNYDPECKGNIGRTCNTFCNFPNSVKPYDPLTGGVEQCGGTTCVITGVTFNEINSTGGAFSINQNCNSSGPGPYVCYLGNDIDIDANKASIGNIQINQNCEKCFIYDVNDPSVPAIEIDCNRGGTSPSPSTEFSLFNFLKSNEKWVLLAIGLLVFMLILWLFYLLKN